MDIILTVEAVSAPLTGIGRYVVELARRLATHRDIERCQFFAAFEWVDDAEAALHANASVSTVRRVVPFPYYALRAYHALRSLRFRYSRERLSGSVLHCPNFITLPHRGPVVLTVHDLSWLHEASFHPYERARFLERELPRSLLRADHVIADSKFVRSELISLLGVAGDRVTAIPLGVDPSFRSREASECLETTDRYGLAFGGYVLAVGTREPRKNLRRLVAAYTMLAQDLRERYPLVIVGRRGWGGDDLGTDADRLERMGQLRMLGYVAEAELPRLYAGARAFAFPSLYEGFGLPPLEAMAAGVPVVTSDQSAMAEVAGDAAILVDPLDVEALRAAIERLLLDEPLRSELVESGLARAAEFSWERCVNETVSVYGGVLR